ncbi:hypothetical protein Sjap_020447 [Stephania japonica]|uniref:DUF641 domain-containing protein n=1 Tax=Stephania japonica TaxID=461633 RepID=A0AAP0F829_9MAGN
MAEVEGSNKPPQISQMFQKFALAFKTKTIEFFAEDEEDESDPLSLLDSAEEFITDQRVVVIKPDSPPPRQPLSDLQQPLISSLFATVSAFEASYLQLQTAHSPFDADSIEAADKASVSQLQKLSEIKNWYRGFVKNSNPNPNPNFSPNFAIGSHVEAQVQENQSLLRTLDLLVNRLQSEIDVRDAEVLVMRQKLGNIEEANSRLAKRLGGSNSASCSLNGEVLLSLRGFELVLRYACKWVHRFSKLLIHLMRKVGWDLDLAANSVHPDVEYSKIGHSRYAFLSYVCLGMFRGFDSEGFGVEMEDGIVDVRKENSLRRFFEHCTGDAMEILSKDPNGGFARFCETKYQQLIHPTMESSLFKGLDQNDVVLSSWRSSAAFYELFVNMASSIWMLHKLALSFDPKVEIFQVENGVDFSMVYMESIVERGGVSVSPSKTREKVGFTVIPGFNIGRTVIQCQVYLMGTKSDG